VIVKMARFSDAIVDVYATRYDEKCNKQTYRWNSKHRDRATQCSTYLGPGAGGSIAAHAAPLTMGVEREAKK
jgi:hypothetical protein